ncbi:MAG: hypothetical protein QX196_01850 [Methylococcaceae bacterium]
MQIKSSSVQNGDCDPSRVVVFFRIDRGCRGAQPPANGWQPSGLQKKDIRTFVYNDERSGVGMPPVTLQHHATLERCRMNSHAGAWELGVFWGGIF